MQASPEHGYRRCAQAGPADDSCDLERFLRMVMDPNGTPTLEAGASGCRGRLARRWCRNFRLDVGRKPERLSVGDVHRIWATPRTRFQIRPSYGMTLMLGIAMVEEQC